jgi:aspartate aminotransferase-like enzyme
MLMKYRLYTPGPTSVPEATLLELARPVHHHRTGEFRAMFKETQSLLQYVYQTRNTVYTLTATLVLPNMIAGQNIRPRTWLRSYVKNAH